MKLLTIFTPAYNRAYILPNLYNSLLAQTDSCFEWVIVDDGSSDNTEELVNSWIKENKIHIVYKKQSNQGKHIAINTGLTLAKGELFFIVDSDDDLTPDAVEIVRHFWNSNRPGMDISGILSYRQFHDGRLVGTTLPIGLSRCKLRETGSKYGSTGDKVVIYRTEVMKKYPYPQFEGERFLGESVVFNQIDDEYDMLVMNSRIYNFDYQEDGLSQDFRKLYRNNPNGFLLQFEQSLKYADGFKARIKTTAHIACLCWHLNKIKYYFSNKSLLLRVLAFPLGLMLNYKIFVLKTSDVKPFVESENK